MTPPRHGAGAGQDDPHDARAYEDPAAFEAAAHRLSDPLNDPLPGSGPFPPRQQAPYGLQGAQEGPQEWYDPEGYQRDWYGHQEPVQRPPAGPQPPGGDAAEPPTEVFHRIDPYEPYDPAASTPRPEPDAYTGTDEPGDVPGTGAPGTPAPPAGGRAERRRAANAKGRGRRRPAPRPDAAAADGAPAKPMTRMEARRAAKAAKDSPAVVISRGIGELFITLGVLMLLFVTYQLWWTNVRADQIAGRETHKIQDNWAKGGSKPEAFEPGQGFAILHIPKLDVVTPIAEGISKEKVLDRGMVGHYSEEPLRTAMPSDKQGNFALAGHRNTHGEPFRYVNRLRPGDPIVVETQEAYYTYEMTRTLPQTSPSNVSVIGPVPPQSGFTKPGRYITLTTCTPEFTSTYRLIVWGKMVDERPRSKGKPDVLVD
ncbi:MULTISPECIES: class E sortase [unclassified Streptomyces]|uniref:class E sortase n=1 Tax=unclassified Streptomyces TaxID=2593676 RepID=UPI000DAD175E|nr:MULTISPECIES: class E sortase [unclassified Streptomyces]PZT72843.1 class E sortase [Streptomyces sp. AC1-42T]PZT80838.1 class E sortase [Streptomyces sp. AC1-42W]